MINILWKDIYHIQEKEFRAFFIIFLKIYILCIRHLSLNYVSVSVEQVYNQAAIAFGINMDP